jgi:integrase
MFNMAERWGMHHGRNPVRLVKFLPENNLQFQTVSEDDETRLLESSPPYLRELILFAINTDLRCGDLLDLTWEEVDIDEKRLSLIMGKTRRRLGVPLNETTLAILAEKQAAKHGPHVFYNPATGDRYHNLKAGFNAVLKRSGLTGITWHTLRLTVDALRRGPCDGEGTPGAFYDHNNYAIRALESQDEGAGRGAVSNT